MGISGPWPCFPVRTSRGLIPGQGFPRRPETRGAVILIWCVKTPVLFLLPSCKLSSSLHIGIPKKTLRTSTQTCLARRDVQQVVGMHKRGTHILFWPAPCLRFSSSCVCNSFCYMSSPLRPDWTDIEKCGFKRFLSSASGQLFMVSRIVKYTESGNGLDGPWIVMTIRSCTWIPLSTHSFRQCRPSFWRSCKICNLGLQILGKAQG